MNLRAAQTELRGRTPRVSGATLGIEVLIVISVSYMLVGIFA